MTSKVCDVRSRGCRLEVPGSPKREKFHGQMTKAVGRTFTISAECRVPCAANGTTVDGGVRTAIKIYIASSGHMPRSPRCRDGSWNLRKARRQPISRCRRTQRRQSVLLSVPRSERLSERTPRVWSSRRRYPQDSRRLTRSPAGRSRILGTNFRHSPRRCAA